ncbi:MAG: hypothetical protein F4130_11585 [Acidobacteria bacterium]|nr:hypothetical protein [Acidobacteriota bacterium]MYI38349.1 hypothetical protein [Acidobacteriota bacterium]
MSLRFSDRPRIAPHRFLVFPTPGIPVVQFVPRQQSACRDLGFSLSNGRVDIVSQSPEPLFTIFVGLGLGNHLQTFANQG